MNKYPITVIIPSRNEERNIKECLESVRFCDQIIVIDSGSTDKTLNIVKEYGVEIYHFDYKGGWPKKRQWAMDNLEIRNPWTFLLDTDERVTPQLQEELKNIINFPAAHGYWISLRMVFLGKILRYGGTQVKKLSFFKTGAGHFEKLLTNQDTTMADMEVHEHIILDGPASECKNYIVHHNVNTLFRYIQKHNEYSNWEASVHFAKAKESLPANFWGNHAQRRRWLKKTFLMLPGSPLLLFLFKYILQCGFMDGTPGFIYCTFQAVQFFHIKAKILEKKTIGYVK